MARPVLILSLFAALAQSAASAGAEGLSPARQTPPPRRTLASDPGSLDPAAGGADAAFAAWLRASKRKAAAQIAEAPTIDEIKAELRRQNRVRDLLGANRFRRLERARFKVHVHELQIQPYRDLEQVSALYDDIEGSMRSNFGKIARDWLEHRLGLDEKLERWERRRDGRRGETTEASAWPSLRFSPRLAAGNDAYVGTKIRVRHAPNAFLSHLSLRTEYGLDDGEVGLRLTWQTRDHYVSLEQLFDDRYLGDVLSLSLRFTF
ncbi:MAG TPA: hypothetical protein VMT85_22705 [Thermoanaerobaculia bacterium]|nr:hypothetical protein [Thermoanaerobaculia bacterium]